eukprot:CAMPEP_0177281900 /NCGR_PEP_ID=MMETSP0367-20130122/71163_1 /TAXON_ID=447022 ORGANISM="Scrippsiella hangoei-like, Strain SHHI-4" /NCGR_SAMPLE_ID=MMETSP0367 /ASSEMBLY_ACC=CAM_ASM_000362 /LENGTH=47 /DNA_ID= /DNA_START= /DNA_END= /DNA_ORIENTATION=
MLKPVVSHDVAAIFFTSSETWPSKTRRAEDVSSRERPEASAIEPKSV